MNAILIHKPGERTGDIVKGLRTENIRVKRYMWNLRNDPDPKIFEAAILFLYIESPNPELLNLLPYLRRNKNFLPIIIIDETENPEIKNRSFELGADAYFSKPLSFRLLAMKLKHLICRKENIKRNHWMRAFDIRLDMEHRFVKRHERIIPLRNKEYLLLEYFMMNRGKLLTRDSLLEYVWDRNADFASNTIDVHINRLRRKIEHPTHEKLIHTVHCMGYIFDKKPNGNK